ncbi:MAG: hypothetical protein DRR19_27335, partial [Candidatus Parabeggiatoa sp. nov. 1]
TENGGIRITWDTATETDSAEFNLWRATAEDGEYENITRLITIAAQGNSTTDTSYSYLDTLQQECITYYYALQEIETDGDSIWYLDNIQSISVGNCE